MLYFRMAFYFCLFGPYLVSPSFCLYICLSDCIFVCLSFSLLPYLKLSMDSVCLFLCMYEESVAIAMNKAIVSTWSFPTGCSHTSITVGSGSGGPGYWSGTPCSHLPNPTDTKFEGAIIFFLQMLTR